MGRGEVRLLLSAKIIAILMHSIGMQEQQQQLAVLVVIFAITLSVLRAGADSCCKWEWKLQGDAGLP